MLVRGSGGHPRRFCFLIKTQYNPTLGDGMKIRWIAFPVLLVVAGFFAGYSMGAQAAPSDLQEQYSTPTAGPDGRILYTVQAGDTCLRIQLLTGVSVEYIRTTNHLDENCTLQLGQKIMIGIGGPSAASPTPGPSPTPSPIPLTPTPKVGGTAQVCVLLYNDSNGDGLRQTTEGAIAGGALSLTSLSGTYSATLTTSIPSDPNAYQGTCFANVPEGKYTVSAAVPSGYNPTTGLTTTLEQVIAGETSMVDFGAQEKSVSTNGQDSGGRSPLMGIIGVIFLLAGVGLGIYAWRVLRK